MKYVIAFIIPVIAWLCISFQIPVTQTLEIKTDGPLWNLAGAHSWVSGDEYLPPDGYEGNYDLNSVSLRIIYPGLPCYCCHISPREQAVCGTVGLYREGMPWTCPMFDPQQGGCP